jgi:hypothetical protein
MGVFRPPGSGWQRDLVDLRDHTPSSKAARLSALPLLTETPAQVDWREYFPPVDDQRDLPTGATHACVAALQYFERRALGRQADPSRWFVHLCGTRLAFPGEGHPSLRTLWKAITRFGAAQERLLPYSARTSEAPAIAYGFHRDYATLEYLRLDAYGQNPEETLAGARRWLAAGFVVTVGIPLYDSLTTEPEIAYPTHFDSLSGGQALLAVGYDDERRIRSDKGALLVRNSWGEAWGERGYGWLPYTYLTKGLAADLWTPLDGRWLDPDEFKRPLAE